MEMVTHPSGSRVILTMLQTMNDSDFIVRQVLDNFELLARNQHAICVIKHLLSTLSQETIQTILQPCILSLSKDPYANYAIQDAIKHDFLPHSLYNTLLSDIIHLSSLKFSSNVIERMMELIPYKVLPMFLETDICAGLVNSHFGFFVAKRAFQIGYPGFTEAFCQKIDEVIEANKKNAEKWKELINSI